MNTPYTFEHRDFSRSRLLRQTEDSTCDFGRFDKASVGRKRQFAKRQARQREHHRAKVIGFGLGSSSCLGENSRFGSIDPHHISSPITETKAAKDAEADENEIKARLPESRRCLRHAACLRLNQNNAVLRMASLTAA